MKFCINHKCNYKVVNMLFCIMKINKDLRRMQQRWMLIKPQQWKYWKMMTIILFIFVIVFLFYFPISIIFCLYVLILLMTYWITLMGNDWIRNVIYMLVTLICFSGCECFSNCFLLLDQNSWCLLTLIFERIAFLLWRNTS